ncbi:glycosyltransferase [Halobacillus fulvus]|nr:glycosyltransferase [Halobacillus fulvus]
MKEKYAELADVDGEKLELLLPMIPDYLEEEPDFSNRNNSLVYAGKFAKEWYTEELLSAFNRIHKHDEDIVLNVAGDKFQGELIAEKEKLSNEMESHPGVNWQGAVSRKQSIDLIQQSDIGVGWRSSVIDHDGSLELSTKLLEYGSLGKPVLLRRTKMHEQVLGEDYFLFVEDEDDVYEKTLEILHNRKLYRKTAKRIYERCRQYTFIEAYKRLKPLLWSYNKQKTKIVFAGHDLKFIQMGIEYFENHPDYEVKIDQWKGHASHDEEHSESCLKWADVIFCEWGLGNAVWYSRNKKQGQKLIVRMHLQERVTEHPSHFTMENIDQVISISPFIYEEFNRVSQIPRQKMTMIYNMIDTEKYDQPKSTGEDLSFNLGVAGILPKRKRLDKALDILEKLWEKDSRYKLYVKSKLPSEVPWLMNREEEKEYYDQIFDRINNAPWKDQVIFDQHGNDMDEWFKKIGYVLSTSDYESFHLAPMEGMASGSVPVVLKWPGSETIYPAEYLFNDINGIIEYIHQENKPKTEELKAFPRLNFDRKVIVGQIEKLIVNL